MIRPAVLSDIPQMLEMGRRFFEASGYADITTFDSESFKATLEDLLVSESAVVLIADGAMAAALIYPFYFQANHRTAQEIFWWSENKGMGSQLLDALIAGVKAKGAESLSMIALEKLNPERVGGYYEKRGFRPSERSFIRRI